MLNDFRFRDFKFVNSKAEDFNGFYFGVSLDTYNAYFGIHLTLFGRDLAFTNDRDWLVDGGHFDSEVFF